MQNLLPKIITLSKTFFRPAMSRMQISTEKKRNLKTTEYHHVTTQIRCFLSLPYLLNFHSSFIATNEIRDFFSFSADLSLFILLLLSSH